jgi:hypothetical protein
MLAYPAMTILTRLLGFGVVVLALGLLGFAAGSLLEPAAPGAGPEPAAEHMEGMGEVGAHPVRGLGIAENDLRIALADRDLALGADEVLRFRILDAEGEALTEFDRSHTKRMHVIVVRRDLDGFQHLHPTMAPDGTWTAPLRLADAGTFRLFADFSHDGEPTTLADDLRVDGAADLEPLPLSDADAVSEPGGYDVSLRAGDPHAAEQSRLRFNVAAGGDPVALRPYLGAGGHLVALREGDLAFLHVHPSGDAGEDGSIEFEATFPTAGRYRLFLQFVVGGELQTVAFTEEVH